MATKCSALIATAKRARASPSVCSAIAGGAAIVIKCAASQQSGEWLGSAWFAIGKL